MDYRRLEGRKRRGPVFERLALALATRHASGATYTEADILRHLDAPDLCVPTGDPSHPHRCFAYRFHSSSGEGVILIDFSDAGVVRSMGSNVFSDDDYAQPGWRPFEGTGTRENND